MCIEFISLIVDILLTFVTGLMAYYTYCMVKSTKDSIVEMELSRKESNSAEIIVFFHINKDKIYFVIENTGKTIAKNIVIKSDKELINSSDIKFDKFYKFDDFPPNYKISSYFDSPECYKHKFGEFPKFKFDVCFETVYGTPIKRVYSWDLGYVVSLGYLGD